MWRRSEKFLPRHLARKGGAIVFSDRWWRSLVGQWHWMLLVGMAVGIIGFGVGYWRGCCTATATLLFAGKQSLPASIDGEVFNLREHTLETSMEMLRSALLMRRVVSASGQALTLRHLATHSEVAGVPGTALLRLSLRDPNPDQAAFLVNLYAQEAVVFAQQMQSNESARITRALQEKTAALNAALETANAELNAFHRSLGITDFEKESTGYARQLIDLEQKSESLRIQVETLNLQMSSLLKEISNHHPAVLSARRELSEALLRYTEEHPRVQKLKTTLESLLAQIAERGEQIDPDIALNGSSLAQSLYTKLVALRTDKVTLIKQLEETIVSRSQLQGKLQGLAERRLEYAKLSSQFGSLKSACQLLAQQQREAQLLDEAAAGYCRIFDSSHAGDLSRAPKFIAGEHAGIPAGFAGILLAGVLILIREATHKRIRSEADLQRVTALPVLAVLGDLNQMDDEARRQWAFTTLTALKGKLNHSGKEALVCGFISSGPGEGRSTWVELLAQAARRCGYQVLTISTSPADESPSRSAEIPAPPPPPDCELLPSRLGIPSALVAAHAETNLEIPLSGWVWDLENRAQWQEAVRRWKTIDNSAVFLELPPASTPEAILLSEDFSSLIWLCGKDMADIGETRAQLETLRCARSDLVGVVFNRAIKPSRKNRLASLAAIVLALNLPLFALNLSAQGAAPQPPKTADDPGSSISPAPLGTRPFSDGPGSSAEAGFSISSPVQLAAWQKHFTLGAGDVLNISLYEQPDSERKALTIGPDGRLNYLQARDVLAADLTVDELRDRLEAILTKYYRPPLRVVIVPQAYNSKKYFLLGNIVQKGVFPLDRPTTIIEAIAKAQGFVTTPERRNSLMLADLPRAFLVRKVEGVEESKRVEVDFEALFLRGDLRQNIALAPGDYLYFPPLDLKEIYILGEVLRPGAALHSPEMTTLRAIASRGGFTERSFRARVLIVRGSLNHPQTLIVNVSDIMKGQSLDVKLEARDIVYVSRKPWYKAEELLEAALSDFMRAAVITWTGKNIGPFIKQPLF